MKHEITTMRTKSVLSSSLKKMMKKKSLSKITVTDIIADCQVNRKTFYYHFQDVYDLLDWTLKQETALVIQQFDLAIEYNEAILYVMEYMENNEYIINCISDSMGLDAIRTFLYNDFVDLVSSIIDSAEIKHDKRLDDDYKKFLCLFYSSAISFILFDWFKSKRREDKTVVCEKIDKTIISSLQGIMQ